MTRDPFSAAAIDADVDAYRASDLTWRRLFGARAKTIPLREMPSITSTAPSGMTRDVVGINEQGRSLPAASQGAPIVQPYVPDLVEKRLLDLLNCEEPVSVSELFRPAKLSEFSARNRLEKLAAKGLVRGVRGRGYLLSKGAEK